MKEVRPRVICDMCDNSECLFKKEGYKEYVDKIEKTPCLEDRLPCFKCGKEIEINREGKGWVIASPKAVKMLKKEMPADAFKAWEERLNILREILPYLCGESCKEIIRKEVEKNIPNYDKADEFFKKMEQELSE